MLGLTSIDLPFHENLRSNWVVVIGLELLSLACPGLDLGSVTLHHITYVTLVTVMVMLILLVWRIGFGVTEIEFVLHPLFTRIKFCQHSSAYKMHINLQYI
jgi:hypothetical protein